jgi:hypothetical protein
MGNLEIFVWQITSKTDGWNKQKLGRLRGCKTKWLSNLERMSERTDSAVRFGRFEIGEDGVYMYASKA